MKNLPMNTDAEMDKAIDDEMEFWNEHADLKICIPSMGEIPETPDEPFPFAGEKMCVFYDSSFVIEKAPATWVEAVQAIDAAILACDDHHHVHLESIERRPIDGRVLIYLGS